MNDDPMNPQPGEVFDALMVEARLQHFTGCRWTWAAYRHPLGHGVRVLVMADPEGRMLVTSDAKVGARFVVEGISEDPTYMLDAWRIVPMGDDGQPMLHLVMDDPHRDPPPPWEQLTIE